MSAPWFPTDTGLPDDDITVLVATVDGEVWPAYLYAGQWRHVCAEPITGVTHWQHLPAAPVIKGAA